MPCSLRPAQAGVPFVTQQSPWGLGVAPGCWCPSSRARSDRQVGHSACPAARSPGPADRLAFTCTLDFGSK